MVKKPKQSYATEPRRDDYRNEASYRHALSDYEKYRKARYVWGQISLEEHVWILEQTGSRDPGKKAAMNFDELGPTRKQSRFIAKYPRTNYRRDIYKAKLAASPRSKDQRVRKHERRLRERGV